MTRPEWVEAGARAANRWPGSGHPWTLRDEVETVIAAVEPLIRADEVRRMADLRTKVEALRDQALWGFHNEPHRSHLGTMASTLERVLALIEEAGQ